MILEAKSEIQETMVRKKKKAGKAKGKTKQYWLK